MVLSELDIDIVRPRSFGAGLGASPIQNAPHTALVSCPTSIHRQCHAGDRCGGIACEKDGGDPIKLGLVLSLNRPGGNITGVTQLNVEVAPKRLELLHELVPTASDFALLVNPADPALAGANTRDIQAAADALGLHLHVLHASTERDLDAAFANLVQLRTGGLVIGSDTFFLSRSRQLATLAVRHAVAAIFETREFVAAGGLISYGGSFTDSYRSVGVYTARILKGEKPSELPVQRGTKVELFLNLKTANALGIAVPLPLSGRADELIE